MQIEWHPDEVFQCPQSKTEVKLFSEIPRNLKDLRDAIYVSYFPKDGGFYDFYYKEIVRIKELNPEITEPELCDKLFNLGNLKHIPDEDKELIMKKYKSYLGILQFISNHFSHYEKYLKGADEA